MCIISKEFEILPNHLVKLSNHETVYGFENCKLLQVGNPDDFFLSFAACGGTFADENGVITSPYHPNPYPGGRQCDYLIQQPAGTRIQLQFVAFDIEGSINCNYDYLEIRDGDSENATLIGKYCGDPSFTPDPIYSSMNFLWMRFVTDG